MTMKLLQYHAPGVYRITNTVNKKVYIGSAFRSLYRRINEHRVQLRGNRHYNKSLQSEWNQYGETTFIVEVVEKIDLGKGSSKLCCGREKEWIKAHDATNPLKGYNTLSSPGDAPMMGRNHTVASKAKMSAAKKGKLSGRLGKKHTAETKAKIAATKIGKVASVATRAKMSATRKGRKMSEYHRQQYIKGHWAKGPNAFTISAKIAVSTKKNWEKYYEAQPVVNTREQKTLFD